MSLFVTFFIALVFGIVGASIVFFAKEAERISKIISFVILTVAYTFLGWWIFYSGLLSFAWPLFGGYGVTLCIWWVISCIVAFCITDEEEIWNHCNWFPIAYVLILILVATSGWSFFRDNSYASLIGKIQDKTQKHWSQDIQPLDPTHIRLVPRELAISLAKTTLGQDGAALGSQFPLSTEHITLQKIKGDYFYLIPLDYKNWRVWTSSENIPGYVKVSATDPYAKPMLITGSKMKYTPGAYFKDNLERRLFPKYKNKVLKDYSFEEDDNGNLFWVISVCEPTISFWGQVVLGVVIFNPETGEDKFLSKEEISEDRAYDWVDRVIPTEIVGDNIDYWGNLKDGWWNWAMKHINLLEGETPILNYSSDGRCMIVTPVTSDNEEDQSMTGLMYTDARTGESVYYATSGGATEEAIIQAVDSATSYKKWHANEQIVYENVYGKLSALVPILGENGNYQGLAIVENENKRVAIGTTPQEALIEFQKLLMSSGGQITTENNKDVLEFIGKIARMGWEISGTGKQYYIYFLEFKHSFALSSNVQSELSLTREGDEVSVKYINSEQASVAVLSFKNISLDLQSSKNEKAVNAQMEERKTEVKEGADVKDFKESLNEMSDDEVKKLMEQTKNSSDN